MQLNMLNIPLAVRGTAPGNEIQSPMAIVILGGFVTATFLNMIVMPVLFHRYFKEIEKAGVIKL